MRKSLLVVFVLIVAFAAVYLAQGSPAEEQIRAQIQKLQQLGPAAFNTDAFIWTAAYSEPVRANDDRTKIQAAIIATPGRRNARTTVTPEKITVSSSGDLAYEFSRFTLTYDDDTGHHERDGALLRVWQKIGADWKVAAFIQRPYGQVLPLPKPF